MMLGANVPLLGSVGGPRVVWEPVADREVSDVAEVVIVWTGDYEAVMVDITNAKPVTDNVQPRIQLSGDGGSTFDGGASDYYNRAHFWHTSQTTFGNAQAHIQLTRDSTQQGSQANEWLFCRLILARPTDPDSKTQGIGWGGYGGSVPDYHTSMYFMQRDAAKRIDAFRFYYDTGNVSEGRIIATGLSLS